MSYEFTVDEIKQVIRAAQVYCPDFSQEQFEALMELEKCLADSGCLEAVCGLVQLEEERGVSCTEALDGYEQLSQQSAELEHKIADSWTKLETAKDDVRQARERLQCLEDATVKARRALEEVTSERERIAKEVVASKKRGEREKKRIDKELEEYRRKADVTREEISGTAQLKDHLASRGFTIEFTLNLCQEFVGHENARGELAEVIKEHGTLTQANAALIEQGRVEKKALESQQAKVRSLEEVRHRLENVVSQLKADVANEDELRRFYRRYQGASVLMEYLAGWKGIYFVRCNNPLFVLTGAFERSSGGARFWTEKPPVRRCPCCNYPDAVYDQELYQALNQPVGTPLQIKLGE